jgi:hypothetical protein
MGGGAASAPAGGAPAGVSSQDWLAYLSQMFGISPAQAGALMSAQGGNSANVPSPDASPMAGTIPEVGAKDFDQFTIPPAPQPSSPLSSSFSSFPTRQPPPAAPTPAPVATTTQPYGGPMAAADAAHAPTGGAYSHMPFPGQRDPQGFWGPRPSAGPLAAGGPISPTNRGGEGAVGGASGVGSTSNPFIQDYRPNMPAEGGGQTRGGPPKMSMLDLSSLFNRGQGVPNPNAPAPNAQAVAATRPVPGPLANAPMPPTMPADVMAQRVREALRNKNWFQNL